MRRLIERSAKNAAATRPISTASIRSKQTVISAVAANTAASARLARTIRRMVCSEIIRNDVTISTPASAASGIFATGPLAR